MAVIAGAQQEVHIILEDIGHIPVDVLDMTMILDNDGGCELDLVIPYSPESEASIHLNECFRNFHPAKIRTLSDGSGLAGDFHVMGFEVEESLSDHMTARYRLMVATPPTWIENISYSEFQLPPVVDEEVEEVVVNTERMLRF